MSMLRLNVCINFIDPVDFGSSYRCFWCHKTLVTITDFGSGPAEGPAPLSFVLGWPLNGNGGVCGNLRAEQNHCPG